MGRIGAEIVADHRRQNLQEVLKDYAFGPFRLDPEHELLTLDGEPLPLGPRVVATLLALVERAGEVVTKDEILDRVWGNDPVGESNVSQSVYTLRKALREHGFGSAIVTVPRRGYRFVAPLAAPERGPLVALPGEAPVLAPNAAARPWQPRRWLFAGAAAAALLAGWIAPAGPARSGPPALSAHGSELYRLGRYYWNLRTPATLAKSARLFANVVATDPRSPLGYAGQADTDLMIADYDHHGVNADALYARARREARMALALDPNSAAASTSLAMLRSAADHDDSGSLREFAHAIALDPAYPVAHHWYGTILFRVGRLAEASRELHRAIELEPVSAATSAWLAEASYYNHRYADAIAYSRLALDLDPRRGGALERLGLAYELAGDLPSAIATFRRMRGGPDAVEAPALLAEAYARAGRRDEARAALRLAVRLRPRDDDTAFALLAAGDRARGLAILAHMPVIHRRDTPAPDPRLERFAAAPRKQRNDIHAPAV